MQVKYFGIRTHWLRVDVKTGVFLTMKMFDELGMGFLTNENECVDKRSILKTANNCPHGKTTIQWEYNLNREVRNGSNKLRTYRTFKNTFETEMYLNKPGF